MKKYMGRVREEAASEKSKVKGIEKFRGKEVIILSRDGTWDTSSCPELKRNSLTCSAEIEDIREIHEQDFYHV